MSAFANSIHRCACRKRLAWQCGIALVLCALWATPALACTQPPGGLPHYTIAQRVHAADVVLEGTVTQVTSANVPDDTAAIDVQRYFKGSGPATVTITNFGSGALCRSMVHVGDHLIFFAKGDSSAVMYASYLSQFDAVSTPTADTIAQIIAAVNSRPRAYLPLLEGDGREITSATPDSADNRMLTGLALLLVVVSVLWFRRLWT